MVLYTTFREKAITKWQPNGEAACISLVIASAVGAWQSPTIKNCPPKADSNFLFATQVYKPGSVLTAIYLVPQSLTGSSRLLEAVGQTLMLLHGVAPDRVYSTPMFPWGGWALTPPFHPHLAAVSLCCTCPEVTLGGRYPLSLPCGARTFLIRCLSACVRGCPTWLRKYCTVIRPKCQISCKISLFKVYYNHKMRK